MRRDWSTEARDVVGRGGIVLLHIHDGLAYQNLAFGFLFMVFCIYLEQFDFYCPKMNLLK